jgi:hypothetical protein
MTPGKIHFFLKRASDLTPIGRTWWIGGSSSLRLLPPFFPRDSRRTERKSDDFRYIEGIA